MHGGDIYRNTIKYDFSVNINPYPIAEEILDEINKTIPEINCYPDIRQDAFRKSVALLDNVTPDEVVGGNGASELIMAVMRTVRPKKLLLPAPTFNGYIHGANSLDDCEIVNYILKPEKDFDIDEDILDCINESIDMLIITNPHNPTGKCISRDLIMQILDKAARNNVVVLLDECFLRLSSKKISAKEYINKYHDLYILDAFTKLFSIPGVRVGYLISASENIKRIKRQLPEWNMSIFSQNIGCKCCDIIMKTSYLEDSYKLIVSEREWLEMNMPLSCKLFKSDCNYMLFRCEDDIYQKLIDRGILIRHCNDYKNLDNNYYRIAVKNRNENQIFIDTLKEILND